MGPTKAATVLDSINFGNSVDFRKVFYKYIKPSVMNILMLSIGFSLYGSSLIKKAYFFFLFDSI